MSIQAEELADGAFVTTSGAKIEFRFIKKASDPANKNSVRIPTKALLDRHDMVPCDEHGNTLGAHSGDVEESGMDVLRKQMAAMQTDIDAREAAIAQREAEITNKAMAMAERIKDLEDQLAAARSQGFGSTDEGKAIDTSSMTEDEKLEHIVDAIGNMDPKRVDHWTSGKLPRVEVLETISGIDYITGDQRATAWERFMKENPKFEIGPFNAPGRT
jgi:hypothetical protein